VTKEEHIDIRITRKDKRIQPDIIERILSPDKFNQDDDCILKENKTVEQAATITTSSSDPVQTQETLQFVRNGLMIRRFENNKTSMWIVEADRRYAQTLEQIFANIINRHRIPGPDNSA
jgi:hypothetical protein